MRDFNIYCGEHAQATTEVQEDVIKLQLWAGQAHENITLMASIPTLLEYVWYREVRNLSVLPL